MLFVVPETNTNEVKEEKKRNKSLGQKRGVTVMGSRSKATVVGQHDIEGVASLMCYFCVS